MKTNRTGHLHLAPAKLSAVLCALFVLGGLLFSTASEVAAQAVRRPAKAQQRIQKKIEKQGGSKLTPAEDSTATSPKPPAASSGRDQVTQQQPSIEGINGRDIRLMFSREEWQMAIPGFGRPPALLIIFRQLNLTQEQKEKIKAIHLRVGNRLAVLQRERAQLEQQIEEAIYGESFSVEKVDELAAQAAAKQGEIIKLQANIEAQFRQILTADQFYVFQFLIGEMVLPQRRLNPQQQQRRFGNQPNPLNRPNRPPPDRDN